MIPLGLGDAIICNGLIREKAKEYGKVYIPCWSHNMPSVKFMFSDLPNVIVQEVSNPNEIFIQQVQHTSNGAEVLKLGCYSGEVPVEPETFDQAFYRQARVPFSKRWDSFFIPEVTYEGPLVRTLVEKPCAFICDSPERGFKINDSLISDEFMKIRSWNAHKIFDFHGHISHCAELHCINSAFAILSDSIKCHEDQKIFLHRYARPYTPYDNFKVRKPWKILA